jgi:hypothetical protein
MKRDMDLIRELLLKLEELPMGGGGMTPITAATPAVKEFAMQGYYLDQIWYHLSLLHQAGFIDAEKLRRPMNGFNFRGITWVGHDFLDSIRDPAIWQATKDGAKKAGGFSLELLSDLAKGLIKKKIEEHTGVQL